MTKPDILMLNPMRPLVETALAPHVTLHRYWDAPDKDALLDAIGPRIRGIVAFVASVPRELMERLPALEIVASAAVGYDGVDVKAAAERGVVVTNTPDVLTDEVADLALGLLLATVREIPRAEKHLRDGLWPKSPYPLTATLRGRTAGIVGLGRIGKAIAKRIEGFGVSVSYHGRRQQADVAYPYFASLIEMAKAVDVLIVVTPGGAETRHLIGKRGAGSARAERNFRQCRARIRRRRTGARSCAEEPDHSRRRPRRVRERAPCSVGTDRARKHRSAAACRFGFCSHARCDGAACRRQSACMAQR